MCVSKTNTRNKFLSRILFQAETPADSTCSQIETHRLQVKRQGALGNPITVTLPPTARHWGEKMKILAGAMGMTSVAKVLLQGADGEVDEMDDKRWSWRLATQPQNTLMIVAKSETGSFPQTAEQIGEITTTTKQVLYNTETVTRYAPHTNLSVSLIADRVSRMCSTSLPRALQRTIVRG